MPIERSEPPSEELAALLAAATNGDQEAWRTLVERYWRRVYALVRSRCGRHDLAEEVTQSVFVTLATKLGDGGYEEQGRFESWLLLIAMNRLRDELRRQRRQATPTDPADIAEQAGTQYRSPAGRSGDATDGPQEDELEALRQAISRLPDQDREIIELRHHAGMGFKVIAKALDEPIGTVLARHHRALKKLRTFMERSESTPDAEQPATYSGSHREKDA